jgi:hypothetical protein
MYKTFSSKIVKISQRLGDNGVDGMIILQWIWMAVSCEHDDELSGSTGGWLSDYYRLKTNSAQLNFTPNSYLVNTGSPSQSGPLN